MARLDTLVELLKKISSTTDHVRVEVDYNGKEFFWKMPQQNITAEEWIPRSARPAHGDHSGLRQLRKD